MPFTFTPTAISDVVLVESQSFPDPRGWFREGFKTADFAEAGLPSEFAQDNLSFSVARVVRGLHFQHEPKPQGKFVSVASGEIWDVALDIRAGSPTFGRWVGEVLSLENGRALWIPPGFAHGFCVLSGDGAVVTYKCTNEFVGALDGGLRFDDPTVAVEWPVSNPVLSEKDRRLPLLADIATPFTYSPPA